jgi:hypothetical protein
VFFVYLVALPIWAAMLVWLFEPAKQAKAEAIAPKTRFPWRSAVLTGGVTLFVSMLYYVFIINGALAFKEVGVTQPERYGALIFVPSLFILAGAALFRLLAMRSNVIQLGAFLLLLGGGLAGIGLATTVPTMIAALIVQQTAAGMAVPTLIAWTQSKYDFAHRGTGMGIWTGAFFLGQSQSPRLVHVIDANMGSMQSAFLVAGVAGLCAAAVAFTIVISLRKAV